VIVCDIKTVSDLKGFAREWTRKPNDEARCGGLHRSRRNANKNSQASNAIPRLLRREQPLSVPREVEKRDAFVEIGFVGVQVGSSEAVKRSASP